MDNRDAEGLVVKSSAVSTLSALCSMFRMLAGLHTVVCVQTHLVGRGERRWLVKSWVVCCAKIHQRVLMMTPPPPQSTLYPRHIPDTGRRSGLWLVPGLLLCGCFRSASCVTLGIAPLKQWPFVDMISCSSIHFVLFDHHYYLLLIVSVCFYLFFLILVFITYFIFDG